MKITIPVLVILMKWRKFVNEIFAFLQRFYI